jgi:hypothetical protein
MSESRDCNPWNLSDSEVELLKVAANTDDTSDTWLAGLTTFKEGTIRSMFGHIQQKMEVHSRGVAVSEALRLGIVKQDPALFELYKNPVRETERGRERESVKRTGRQNIVHAGWFTSVASSSILAIVTGKRSVPSDQAITNRRRYLLMKSRMLCPAMLSIGLLWLSSCLASAIVTFGASATLTNPAEGATYHTGAGQTQVGVPYAASNMSVTISGAQSQQFNVQWTIELELNNSPITGTTDLYNGLITCPAFGNYIHNNTANMTPTPAVTTGSKTATAYVDFYDQGNANNADNEAPTHNFTVVSP